MNFLAHLYLTKDHPKLTIGNYLADFIRNRDLVMFSPKIISGIKLHRFIDSYTDNHEIVLGSTRILRKRHKKYAPVVIDVFYDYILSKNWDKFSDVSIRAFADEMYSVLNSYSEIFPFHIQDLTYRMIANDFLLNYGTEEGMNFTFGKISKRAKFASNLITAFDDLQLHYDHIEEGFLEFFPLLIEEVNKRID